MTQKLITVAPAVVTVIRDEDIEKLEYMRASLGWAFPNMAASFSGMVCVANGGRSCVVICAPVHPENIPFYHNFLEYLDMLREQNTDVEDNLDYAAHFAFLDRLAEGFTLALRSCRAERRRQRADDTGPEAA